MDTITITYQHETYDPDAVNEHLHMTVREILALNDCACGHEAGAHLEDGLLEQGTPCADMGWDHQGCMCRGYRPRMDGY